jgi:hypothetical protein
MKRLFYTLIILLAVAGICVVTCPDKEAHSDALKDLLNTMINSEFSKGIETEEDAGFAALGSALGTGIGGWIIDNMLTVENYFVCSVGYVTYDGETRAVSLGVLNHVFTPDEEQIIANMN